MADQPTIGPDRVVRPLSGKEVRGTNSTDVVLRPLVGIDDFESCYRLQKRVWGSDFRDAVSPVLLMVIEENGGLVAGAFHDGRLTGFVFGFPGRQDGMRYHWSHMLAVDPEARGRGLGRRLKLYQRETMLEADIAIVYWTFDPLVSRNAHLNLNRLGVTVEDYVPNKYGTGTGSRLHGSLGTDRFVVRWDLDSRRVTKAIEGDLQPASLDGAEIVVEATDADLSRPRIRSPLPGAGAICIEIPRNIHTVRKKTPEAASRWRELTARAFQHYLADGYAVAGLVRQGTSRCFYRLER